MLRFGATAIGAHIFDPTGTQDRYLKAFGVAEMLTRVSVYSDVNEPQLAESWSWDSSMTVLTMKVRKGVQLHGGWGEMTADDWEYTIRTQDTGPRGYAFYKDYVETTKVVDLYTFQFVLKKPSYGFFRLFIGGHTGYAPITIYSKKRFDTLGPEGIKTDIRVGTGPFRLTKWSVGDEVRAEAVENHWRKTPEFAELRVAQIKEASAQVAALKAGELDVIVTPVPLLQEIEAAGFKQIARAWGGFWEFLTFGQYCFTEWDGKPLPTRPAYDPTKPWIGKCDDPASMERARKVRWAMSMAIDKEGLVKTLLSGHGKVIHAAQLADTRRIWHGERAKKWVVPYDVAKAKAYLAEAGYPGGFEITFTSPSPCPAPCESVFDAVARDLGAIGVKIKGDKVDPGVFYNEKVGPNRLYNGAFLMANASSGTNPEEARLRRNPGMLVNTGIEMPEAYDLGTKAWTSTNEEEEKKNQGDLFEWHWFWQYSIPLFEMEGLITINPKTIADWPMTRGSGDVYIDNPEYAARPK